MDQVLLTTDEVAKHFGTMPATVRYWRHISKGPRSSKVGRRVPDHDGTDRTSHWLPLRP